MKNLGSKLFLLLVLVMIAGTSSAAITISSITTTPSTCGNNGTATVFASSSKSNPFLIYELVSGPATAPLQNNSTFSSLFPGTYTVRVYDIDFVSRDAQFTIIGNYQLPALNPIAINPVCPGFNDGKIIGNPTLTTGRAPYSWQIISPYTSAVQSSDTFNNLSSGSYTIRMSDACGNFQTRTVILVAGSTGLTKWGFDMTPSVIKIGCNVFAMSQYFSILKEKAKIPVTLTINTSSGVRTKRVIPIPLDTTNYTPGLYEVRDTISGLDYGDYFYLCITDTCGSSICANRYTIAPFEFVLEYKTGIKCGNTMSADIIQKNPPYYPYLYTTYQKPAKMTLRDIATNTIVDSMTCIDNYCLLSTQEQTAGRNYELRIVDGCGKVFQQTLTWPVPAAPQVQAYPGVGCMDSTAQIGFNIMNFKSKVKLEIISGPTSLGSTKPKYAFQDVITYPKTFDVVRGNGFSLKNLPVGTYQYRVYDSCGSSVTGSVTVQPSNLADFSYSYSIRKGCLGDNILYIDPNSSMTVGVYIRDSLNNILYQRRVGIDKDSLTSLPPGKYFLEIYYGYYYVGGQLFDGYLSDHNSDCWAIYDTIVIPPYSNNTFKSNTTVFCNGNSYLQINVDSTRGVPPYQYEISSGPQTFPLQSGNTFNIATYGNYVIRIQDACGNSNVRQISIDSAKFPPVIKKGASCLGNKITLMAVSSSYFRYEWKRPNGTTFVGDSLVLNPLTVADTGVYEVTKTVTINGCSDSFKASYHLYANDITRQTIPFCQGTTVQVGTKTYTSPGVYTDTLSNALGCDSIVITSLLPGYKKDSTARSICPGQSISTGLHTYNQTGIYRDTLITASGCDSIIVLNLTILPYKRHTINRAICPGQSTVFGGQTYTSAGTYRDTLTTATCDSIVTLQLSIASLPVVNLGHDTSFCQGQSVLLNAGNHKSYYWNNNFNDSTKQTFPVSTPGKNWVLVKNTAGCTASDTIEILNVYTAPTASAGPDQVICAGNTAALTASGGIRYLWQPSGETTPSISVQTSTTTTYSVIVYDNHQCASAPDQITIKVIPLATLSVFEKEAFTHCFDDGPVTLNAIWGTTFLWNSTGETTQSISVQQEGNYTVTVTDTNGCKVNATMQVTQFCPPQLFLPSAFSPNGDQQHDDLEIFGRHFKNFELKIFNRWGEIIFISHDRSDRWDGKYRGEEMPVGTYPWIISYQGEYDDSQKEITLKGSITLIR